MLSFSQLKIINYHHNQHLWFPFLSFFNNCPDYIENWANILHLLLSAFIKTELNINIIFIYFNVYYFNFYLFQSLIVQWKVSFFSFHTYQKKNFNVSIRVALFNYHFVKVYIHKELGWKNIFIVAFANDTTDEIRMINDMKKCNFLININITQLHLFKGLLY